MSAVSRQLSLPFSTEESILHTLHTVQALMDSKATSLKSEEIFTFDIRLFQQKHPSLLTQPNHQQFCI